MCCEREGCTGSCEIAVTVAGVQHSRQYSFTLHAFFADVSIPIKGCGRAEESVVMKGMYNWYTLLCSSIERGWRNYGEGVVHVNNVWLILLDRLCGVDIWSDGSTQPVPIQPADYLYLHSLHDKAGPHAR